MGRKPTRYDRVEQHMTRRRAIAGGAALLTAGGSLVLVGEPARAAVTIDSWTVPDESFEADAIDPVVDANVAFEFDVGTADVSAIALELLVDGHTVASDELVTSSTSAASETTLSGRVVDSDAWTAADFDPDVGGTLTQEVTVAVRLAVLAPDDSEIVTARAEDTAVVSVAHPQDSQYVCEVGGEAVIRDGSA